MRQEHDIGVVRFANEAGVSTRTVRDTEREKNPRKLRRETAIKYAQAWVKFGVNPTDVEEVSEALGVGPRYRRPELDMSGIYENRELKDRIGVLIETRMQELRQEVEREIEREVERRVAERITAQQA